MDHLDRLSENTAYRLAEASRRMREYCNQQLATLNVKPAQISALAVLCDQKLCMPSDVARLLGISRPSVTNLLERMERDGLIQRMKNRENMRRVWIVPTPKGNRILKAAHKIYQRFEDDLGKAIDFDLADFQGKLQQLSKFSIGDLPIVAPAPDPAAMDEHTEASAPEKGPEADKQDTQNTATKGAKPAKRAKHKDSILSRAMESKIKTEGK
jgi:MarR family transcriptional regulator, organic hydroperoxide resistance regulator